MEKTRKKLLLHIYENLTISSRMTFHSNSLYKTDFNVALDSFWSECLLSIYLCLYSVNNKRLFHCFIRMWTADWKYTSIAKEKTRIAKWQSKHLNQKWFKLFRFWLFADYVWYQRCYNFGTLHFLLSIDSVNGISWKIFSKNLHLLIIILKLTQPNKFYQNV